MSREKTIYRIPVDPEYYGPYTSDEEALECARIIAGEIDKYAKLYDLDVEVQLVPETLSRGNRSSGDLYTIEELDDLLQRNWTEWIKQYESGNVVDC